MLRTNAIFQRKEVSLETQPCTIEAIEVMSKERYDKFAKNFLSDWQFIADRKDDMFTDLNGEKRCLLAMNEESGNGILIDSSGYDYARYVSFMPNIKPYIERQIFLVVDQTIKDAAENSTNGSWVIDTEEISEKYGITVKDNNGIGGMLLNELEGRKEMAEIISTNDCFDMVLYLDYCKNLEDKSMQQGIEM